MGEEPVVKAGAKGAAPQPEYVPEPLYSDFARQHHFQGVVIFDAVVDSAGKVRRIGLVHPLGLGLDEMAVDAVSRWKFRPAMRDGQPVACALKIEVDFHLY